MTISNAYNSIQNYRKRYGVSKAVRVAIHFAIRYFKKSSLKSNNYIVKTNGYNLSVLPNDLFGTSAELLIFKTHEPVSTKIIEKKLKRGMTCLEIGANIGYYTLLEHKIIGNEGKIIALEPSPVNFDILQKNVKSQKIENIILKNIAGGDIDGNVKFLIYEGAGNSCMVIQEGQKQKWPGKIIDVPIRKIDSVLEELGIEKIDFLRMDVEGYENHVLNGLSNTLKSSKPIIHIEVHVNIVGRANTITMLKNLQNIGYDVTAYVPREIDTPVIGTISDIRNYDMNKIIDMITKEENPSFLMLTLENQ